MLTSCVHPDPPQVVVPMGRARGSHPVPARVGGAGVCHTDLAGAGRERGAAEGDAGSVRALQTRHFPQRLQAADC